MATLHVGPDERYTTISSAVAAAHSGDTIDVDSGTYTNDFATINKSLTLQAVGGPVNEVATSAPSNGKAILDVGGPGVNVTINGFAFSGAAVPDGNGAGIRYEGGNLTLNDDYFHNNQEGLLAASDPNGSITINNSEFSHNGTGDGYTHNLYVGEVGHLTINHSYFHDAVVGHEIKSRALDTTIENSRIEDGPHGTASYDIDLPNGGKAVIKNNVIEKGPHASNPTMISFGEEGGVYSGSSLTVSGNTVINDDPSSSVRFVTNTTKAVASITGNKIYGLKATQIASGPAHVSGTIALTREPFLNTSHPWAGTGMGATTAESSAFTPIDSTSLQTSGMSAAPFLASSPISSTGQGSTPISSSVELRQAIGSEDARRDVAGAGGSTALLVHRVSDGSTLLNAAFAGVGDPQQHGAMAAIPSMSFPQMHTS